MKTKLKEEESKAFWLRFNTRGIYNPLKNQGEKTKQTKTNKQTKKENINFKVFSLKRISCNFRMKHRSLSCPFLLAVKILRWKIYNYCILTYHRKPRQRFPIWTSWGLPEKHAHNLYTQVTFGPVFHTDWMAHCVHWDG